MLIDGRHGGFLSDILGGWYRRNCRFVFGGIAGIIGTTQEGAQVASLASVCCVCVLVAGGVAIALSPAGQNAGKAAAAKF